MAPERRPADVPERAVSAAESPAREPDLAQHRRQGHDHPGRLLTVLHPLERPIRVDESPPRGHPARQRPDRLGRNPRQPRRPLGRLRAAVLGAAQVALEALEAGAVSREERAIAALLVDQGMREPEHDGDVRPGHDREPLGLDELGQIVTYRAQQHELRPAGLHRGEMVPEGMPARSAGAHHRVLERDAAEADEQLRVALDHRPGGRPVEVPAHVPEDVGHDDGEGAVAVTVLAADESPEAVEEAMKLALRVVEATRARPAVGAAIHRLAAVSVVDAAELPRQKVHGRRPADRHERLGAPAPVGPRTAVEPAGPDHRLGDARAR